MRRLTEIAEQELGDLELVGTQSCGKATYLEIDAPERIVYEDAFADADGNPLAEMPVARITVEFVEADGKTAVQSTVRYPAKAAFHIYLAVKII